MSKRSYLGPIVLCILGAIFATGLYQIFRIRLMGGDLYPAWSSLRSDPDGTRVLFDSLAGTGRIETIRKYKGLGETPERDATILFAGYSPMTLLRASNADLDEFERTARSGNRIVVAMDPGQWFLPPQQETGGALAKRWDIGVDRVPGDEATIALFFDKAEGWIPLKTANGRPVVIERAFGSGSIVLAANSDMFANQTVATKRDSALLAQLLDTHTRVVFDESHLGVQDTGSVLGLVHKYRMDGLLWGLLAITFVFVWGHGVGFPPPERAPARTVIGYDSRAGLGQLLRRQIPLSRLIETCVSEWERANARARLTIPEQTDPLAAYTILQQQLTRK